jgi:hypothetical protein
MWTQANAVCTALSWLHLPERGDDLLDACVQVFLRFLRELNAGGAMAEPSSCCRRWRSCAGCAATSRRRDVISFAKAMCSGPPQTRAQRHILRSCRRRCADGTLLRRDRLLARRPHAVG